MLQSLHHLRPQLKTLEQLKHLKYLERGLSLEGRHGHLRFSCLLYVVAKKQAETVHLHKQQFTHIEHLSGLFFAQSHARTGAAVARGMALRAMGCSLMGVSKVFLLHVAPTCGAQCLTHSGWGTKSTDRSSSQGMRENVWAVLIVWVVPALPSICGTSSFCSCGLPPGKQTVCFPWRQL
jgi:hypothetical protein